MRLLFWLTSLIVPACASASVPAEFETALSRFRAEGPPGWSFVQTTEGAGQSRIERFDAARGEFERWSLIQQDGREPTAAEVKDYREKQSRRSSAINAPKLTDQLDLSTLRETARDGDRVTYHCRLKPDSEGDSTARFLEVAIVLHRTTNVFESVEIVSTEPFSPALAVKIAEMKTVMTYSIPDGDRPSLLLSVTTHLRGRAFLVKSLDADMTMTRSDYVFAGKKR